MLLHLTTTHRPASDLGYLLHKNPARVQSFDLNFGRAHVFYPEASEERCTATLYCEVDTVEFVRGGARGRGRSSGGPSSAGLDQYVNDRPYVASSLLSVAMSNVFGSAMNGRSKERPELAATAIPLSAEIPALRAKGGVEFLKRLFEPLGYEVEAERLPLDPQFPEWGEGSTYTLRLTAETTLQQMLEHLYVLLPVLDDQKHYYVGRDEVEKLLHRGEGWLPSHPAKDAIAHRYLSRRRSLAQLALDRLQDQASGETERAEEASEQAEQELEKPIRLNDLRMRRVHETLVELGARTVVDLGCGEGRLMRRLFRDRRFDRIVGFDVSTRSLEIAARRLWFDTLAPAARARVDLFQGGVTYRDERFEGYDAACCIEVIEHMDLPRLGAFEQVVFECAKPKHVVVTTPNREFNARFERLTEGRFRHGDHRFEWTRAEFEDWARGIAERRGYSVRFEPIGEVDDALGAPTQMGVFSR